ncbi:hypothetical protein ROLI_001220 [Roseobacter fucihabitans]|uniref:Uncharacterized protein n=1 Tax=Roseobacter fucihabitans TaxID=1537242 RepID=A0ABZ2BLT8_9RHOB|nr:hypothetical protein [Roseobacter litoralis]MBC6963373.1 hypothetical protein [Roseobacter litoralis]
MTPYITPLFCWLTCFCLASLSTAQTLDPDPLGPLFDWQSQRCERWDIVDTPARAWRDDRGLVHLLAGAETSRASVGETLSLSMPRDCAPRLTSARNPDPALRDDRRWIASVFTDDGSRVAALVHAEYHGHRHKGRCAAARYMPCWRNAILAAQSVDGGRSFEVAQAPVATLPYRYDPAQSRRSGYFNPSNMFVHDGWLYAYFFAETYKAQKRGVCLMRRAIEGNPHSWRFWNGQDFTGRFADPYREPIADPERHVCMPLPGLKSVISSVIKQGKRFLAVTPMTARHSDGRMVSGIWTMQSTDLLRWEAPKLLIAAPLLWRRDCDLPYAVAYPSLLNPQSTSRMFDTVGEELWLIYVRIALNGDCKAQTQRDLIGHRINWPLQAVEVPEPK